MSSNILYSNASSLPDITHGFFHRHGVEKLMEQAINNPLVTVTAGAGYGKTQAVAAFLHDSDLPFVWLQLSGLDNLTSRFWESFVYAIAMQNPYIAGRLANAGFPYSEAQFDDFLHRLADAISEIGKVVFVFDDFHLIEEPSITNFFEKFLNARLKELTIILISREKVRLDIPGKLTNRLMFRIDEENLRFSLKEMTDYFNAEGIPASEEWIRQIHQKTEGWISAIYLIGLSLKRSKSTYHDIIAPANQQIFELIEEEIFVCYSPDVQKLLIELSVLDDFSLELLKELVDLDIILSISKTNTFIYFNPITKNYRFHNLFQEFLSEKLAYLKAEKIKKTHLKIADWYYKQGFLVDALVYYEKCGEYNKICEILKQIPIDLPVEEANLFLDIIESIPQYIINKNPIMRVIHARLLLNNGRATESICELNDIRNVYEALPDTQSNREILGEAYIFLAMISLMSRNLEFAQLFRMADQCLPDGSSLVDNRLYINNGGISVTIEKPIEGEVKRFEEAMSYAAPYASRVMHGCCYGTDFLTKSEAAFCRGDMTKAEQHAFTAIYRAQQQNQNDIICCAYFILIRISLAAGNYEKTMGFLDELRQKIEKPNCTDCICMMDIFKGWLFTKLDDIDQVADWIKSEERSASMISPNSSCNDRFVRAYYLLQKSNYYELLAYLEYLEEVYERKGFLIPKLETQILKSITAHKVGDSQLSFASLKRAYHLSHANHLIMHFIEQGSKMRAVVESYKRNGDAEIPEQWLAEIRGKSNTYAKKLSIVVERYKISQGKLTQEHFNLTAREKSILQHMCQGLNREQIARELFISTNTVKSSLQTIYGKIGAENKADAVRIAMQMEWN